MSVTAAQVAAFEAERQSFWERLLTNGQLKGEQLIVAGLQRISDQLAAQAKPGAIAPQAFAQSGAQGIVAAYVAPFSFSDLIQLLASGGTSVNVESNELPNVTVVGANSSATVVQDVPTNRILLIDTHTLYADPASNDFLVSLDLNGQPLFTDMPMSQVALHLSGAFLGPVTSNITWTIANNYGSAIAFTEHLEGIYVDKTAWDDQILPAIQANAALALAMGSALKGVSA